MHVVHSEIRVRETEIFPRECEKQEDLKDGLNMSADLTTCRCMHVKQLHQLIKLKENEACEEIHHSDNCWCKNGKTHAKIGKGNL